MDALVVALIYVVPFVAIGLIVRRWMIRRNVDLADVRAQGPPGRGKRFLLGFWRDEDPK
jgi:hypothetical protein